MWSSPRLSSRPWCFFLLLFYHHLSSQQPGAKCFVTSLSLYWSVCRSIHFYLEGTFFKWFTSHLEVQIIWPWVSFSMTHDLWFVPTKVKLCLFGTIIITIARLSSSSPQYNMDSPTEPPSRHDCDPVTSYTPHLQPLWWPFSVSPFTSISFWHPPPLFFSPGCCWPDLPPSLSAVSLTSSLSSPHPHLLFSLIPNSLYLQLFGFSFFWWGGHSLAQEETSFWLLQRLKHIQCSSPLAVAVLTYAS